MSGGLIDIRQLMGSGMATFIRGIMDSRKTVLKSPLTSTSWDGDAYSTTAKTLIDLSAVFGVPPGIKEITLRVGISDSGSASGDASITLSPNNTAGEGMFWRIRGLTNGVVYYTEMVVPCDANGDIYYQITATGAGSLNAYIQVWGYYI